MNRLDMVRAYYNDLTDENKQCGLAKALKAAIECADHYKKKTEPDTVISASVARDFIERFNSVTGKKIRVLSDKARGNINARIKEGFAIDEILSATEACSKNEFHVENELRFLTPDFITRQDKLQMYLDEYRRTGMAKRERAKDV